MDKFSIMEEENFNIMFLHELCPEERMHLSAA